MSFLTLLTCVGGIYASFVSWSFLHERISTATFDGHKFKAPLFVQLVQNLFACSIGLIYLYFTEFRKHKALVLGKEKTVSYGAYLKTFYSDPSLAKYLLLVSITQSISSPVANASLDHVDFVTYLLAKSCKLIPVLVIHTVLYKRRFPAYKYAIALLITFGVFLFSYKKPGVSKTESTPMIGLLYLFGSLILDGLTNLTQDQMFRRFPKMTGIHLMVSLNFMSFFLVLGYLTLLTDQLRYALAFIKAYPEVMWKNIVWYAICGSVGQIFIFLTLAAFDLMVLITINVTRKMVSMIVSLIVFNHPLNITKVIGIGLVFLGIGLESYLKMKK